MRIAYIDNKLSNNLYLYYSCFYNALRSQNIEIHSFDHYPGNLKGFDVVIFGLGFFSEDPRYYPDISIDPKIKKVAILHKIKNHFDQKLRFCTDNNIDLLLTTTPFSKRIEKDCGIKTRIAPYCVDAKLFRDLNIQKKYDIGFSGALHAGKKNGCELELENIRVKIKDKLDDLNLKVFWNGSDLREDRIHSTEEYVTRINECKLWLCVTGPSYDVNPRYHEVSSCGTVVFTNDIPKSEYDSIFRDMQNCVRFKNDLSDFNYKLEKALLDYNTNKQNIYIDTQKYSSYESRGKQLLKYINQI